MKPMMGLGLLSFTVLALGSGEAEAQTRGQRVSQAASSASLTADEQQWILYMREEEKVARDVYLTLDALWGGQTDIFRNIAESEQRHMDAVKGLITRYGLVDPVQDDTAVGVFSTPEFQQLYLELVASGSTGIVEAFSVGVDIEEKDLVDLGAALEVVERTDIRTVFENLLDGSLNHLDAFLSQF